MLWCYLRSPALLGFPAAALSHGQKHREGQLKPVGDRNTPKAWQLAQGHARSPVATSTRVAGHAGAGAGAAAAAGRVPPGALEPASLCGPRRGWRWARRPPRMLHHEATAAPAPSRPGSPACQPVFFCIRAGGRDGGRTESRRSRGGVRRRRARRLEAPVASPTTGQQPEAFAAAGAEPEPRLQNPAELCGLGKPGGKRLLQGPAGLLPEQRLGSNSWGLCRSSSRCCGSPRSGARRPPLGFWHAEPRFYRS